MGVYDLTGNSLAAPIGDFAAIAERVIAIEALLGDLDSLIGLGDVQEKIDSLIDYDRTMKSVAHRGYSAEAPENTLPAYVLAKKKGFGYVETDVSFSSDGVPVCLHDSTISRTSNGTGNVNSLTLAKLKSYDFGSWFDPKFAGTQIPTLEEFLILCKNIQLHPYIEFKNSATYSQAQIRSVVDLVESVGLRGRVTYISFTSTYLEYVRDYDPMARLGFLVSKTSGNDITAANVSTALSLKTEGNEVFIDTSATSAAAAAKCLSAHLPMECWTIDSAATVRSLPAYVSGVTSNLVRAGKVLYDSMIGA